MLLYTDRGSCNTQQTSIPVLRKFPFNTSSCYPLFVLVTNRSTTSPVTAAAHLTDPYYGHESTARCVVDSSHIFSLVPSTHQHPPVRILNSPPSPSSQSFKAPVFRDVLPLIHLGFHSRFQGHSRRWVLEQVPEYSGAKDVPAAGDQADRMGDVPIFGLGVNVEPSTLKEFEDMVRKDFVGPGPYPTYALQTISKLAATYPNPSSPSSASSQLHTCARPRTASLDP
jgi:hypothetical protein